MDYRKEGMQNYMVLPCSCEAVEGYESMLMQFHPVPHMIPYEVRSLNEHCELYYRLQYRTTLGDVMGHLPFTLQRIKSMLESIVEVLFLTEEFLFDVESILWNPAFIFIEADTGRLQFCSYPERDENTSTLRSLVQTILAQIDKRDDETVLYVLQFYNLITEQPCDLSKLRSYRRNADMQAGVEDKEMLHRQGDMPEYRKDTAVSSRKPQEFVLTNESVTKAQKKEKSAGTYEKVIRFLLISSALSNLCLILLLVFDQLPYAYVRYLLGSMGVMIVMTILYMNISKEETPDEMMQAYFEEHGSITGDRVQADYASAVLEDHHNSPTQEPERKLQGASVDWNLDKQKEPEYGQTTVLSSAMQDKNDIVEEKQQGTLCLASMIKDRFPVIRVEQSVVIGCMQEGCGYLLRERGISRMHAKIIRKPEMDELYIVDLNSTNGTFVNGEAIISGEEILLEEGDLVGFACCEFYVVRKV